MHNIVCVYTSITFVLRR